MMTPLLNRIITGWTWKRMVFLGVGIWIITQSALNGEWVGVILGAWPAIMGVFGVACAGSNCNNAVCEIKRDEESVQN